MIRPDAFNLLHWVSATRPAFLSITLLATMIGFSHALWRTGSLAQASLLAILLAVTGALLAHAGANILNDVADADNGSDAANIGRVPPFTGGSRTIQEGRLSRQTMHQFGWSLLAISALSGFLLLAFSDGRLVVFGILGLLLAFAYSLPPLKLMARGLGELTVVLAWLLIVTGCDFVIRHEWDWRPWLAGLPFALHAGMILVVNQIPDRAADLRAGKRNWTVRLDRKRGALPYALLLASAHMATLVAVTLKALPLWALATWITMPLGWKATHQIHRAVTAPNMPPDTLLPPIRCTLLQAHLAGVLLVLCFFADRLLGTAP